MLRSPGRSPTFPPKRRPADPPAGRRGPRPGRSYVRAPVAASSLDIPEGEGAQFQKSKMY